MRRFKKGCAVVLTLALSASLLTACGSEKEKTGELKSSSATSTDATSTDAEAPEYETIEDMVDAYAKNVVLGDYKGIEYEDKSEEVTDDDVQDAVDSFVDSLKSYDEDKESAAKDGDTVNIDFVGTVDGEEFDGGNSNGSGYDLELGSGTFIDGFEEQIVGHKPGETFTVTATFPEDYGVDELNGKEAEFETTLNYIKVDVPAEYSDALVAENTDYSTMEEYEASVRKQLEDTASDNALASAQNEVMVKVINNCEINNLSVAEVQQNASEIIASIQESAESYSIDYAQYIYYMYGYDDEDEFAEYVYDICEETQKERMVVCAVAKAEGITITDDEAEAFLENYAEENSVSVDTLKENLSDIDIKYNALAEKVMNFMIDNAVAVEPDETTETTQEE